MSRNDKPRLSRRNLFKAAAAVAAALGVPAPAMAHGNPVSGRRDDQDRPSSHTTKAREATLITVDARIAAR